VGRSEGSETISELVQWLAKAPAGTMLAAAAISELLESARPKEPLPPAAVLPVEPTWRERLWTAPAETRIGVRELAEAVGRPRSWVYRRTAPSADRAPLPHRKLDGELVFVVGEIRAWLREHETVLVPAVEMAAARGH